MTDNYIDLSPAAFNFHMKTPQHVYLLGLHPTFKGVN